MNKEDVFNRLEFIVACVGEFAMRFGLSNREAYSYLRRFNGIEYLLKHYETAHTLSIQESVEHLKVLCLRKGGKVA